MKSLLEHLEAAGEYCTPQIRAAFLALEARLAELEARVRSQAEEIEELKRRLKQNSSNSSLPPSQDPPHFSRPSTKQQSRQSSSSSSAARAVTETNAKRLVVPSGRSVSTTTLAAITCSRPRGQA